MTRYFHNLIQPGRYDLGDDLEQTFSGELLTEIAANTSALMDAGYRIPVLSSHAAPGSASGGPQQQTDAGGVSDAVGWLTRIDVQPDGSLECEIDLFHEASCQKIDNASVAHTSPEIRTEFTDSAGNTLGAVIAHLALTNQPRFEAQGPLQRTNTTTLNRPFSPKGEPAMPSPDDNDTELETSPPEETITEEREPETENPETDSAESFYLPLPIVAEAALGAEEYESTDTQDELPPATLPEASPAEHPERSYRDALRERIHRSRRIPRGLRDRLSAVVGAVQLSRDGSEEPTLRLSDAITLLEESLPEQVTLEIEQLHRATHPHGETFFTGEAGRLSQEEAQKIAQEQLAASGF